MAVALNIRYLYIWIFLGLWAIPLFCVYASGVGYAVQLFVSLWAGYSACFYLGRVTSIRWDRNKADYNYSPPSYADIDVLLDEIYRLEKVDKAKQASHMLEAYTSDHQLSIEELHYLYKEMKHWPYKTLWLFLVDIYLRELVERNLLEELIHTYDEVCRIENEKLPLKSDKVCFHLGQCLVEKHRIQEADKLFQQFEKHYPKSSYLPFALFEQIKLTRIDANQAQRTKNLAQRFFQRFANHRLSDEVKKLLDIDSSKNTKSANNPEESD